MSAPPEPKLPEEVEAALQAYANAIVFHEGASETRAALVDAITEYGRVKYKRGYKDSDDDYYEEASRYD